MRRLETQTVLILAFAASAACFLLATTYTQLHARDIDEAANSIAGNAAPSIEDLATVRSGYHQSSSPLARA